MDRKDFIWGIVALVTMVLALIVGIITCFVDTHFIIKVIGVCLIIFPTIQLTWAGTVANMMIELVDSQNQDDDNDYTQD